MKYLVAALLALTLGTVAVSSAHAYYCTTTCNTFGNQTTCTQTCF